MVPWNMLPKDLQKALLAIIVLGGTRVIACSPPIVCDPAPPPTTSPRLTPGPLRTPMICDPAPPPRTGTPITPLKTPMICDPAPAPTVARAPTQPPAAPAPTKPPAAPAPRQFQVRSLKTSSDPMLAGAKVQGRVTDQQGQPLGGLKVAAQGKSQVRVVTGSGGEFSIYIPEPGDYSLIVESDEEHAVQLGLKLHDLVTVEWVEVKSMSLAPLPLAEIRTVDILWEDGLTFDADTPWPDARYRWSVSGGTLVETDEGMTWQPPTEPGRYLLQVIADWGQAGLAVDSLTLIVQDDGSVIVS